MGRRGELPFLHVCTPADHQAKFFTEVRLLQRAIKVRLLSAPVSLSAAAMSGPTPAAAAGKGNALPAPSAGGASIIIGTA
jgi:staphylococcal nuclease domain-containing protein 1